MKRLRVEIEVPEGFERWWEQAAAGSYQTIFASADVKPEHVRSVEVIEPERWTELTLRAARSDLPKLLPEGATVYVDANGRAKPWRVVSCVEREEYPT